MINGRETGWAVTTRILVRTMFLTGVVMCMQPSVLPLHAEPAIGQFELKDLEAEPGEIEFQSQNAWSFGQPRRRWAGLARSRPSLLARYPLLGWTLDAAAGGRARLAALELGHRRLGALDRSPALAADLVADRADARVDAAAGDHSQPVQRRVRGGARATGRRI